MRQIIAFLTAVKSKLKHLHTRKTAVSQQPAHLGRQITEVLRDDGKPRHLAPDRFDESKSGSRFPIADSRRFRSRRNGVIAGEAAEMIDAHRVINACGRAQAANPPGIAVGGVAFPVVKRIAPELPIGRKGIGRDTGHGRRHSFTVRLKKLAVRPQVGGVGRHIDRQIADDQDAVCVCIRLEALPLAEKEILHCLPKTYVVRKPGARRSQHIRLAAAQRLRPRIPGVHAAVSLDRHIQCVFVKPRVLRAAEGRKLRCIAKTARRVPQDVETIFIQSAIIDGIRVVPKVGGSLIARQKLLLN